MKWFEKWSWYLNVNTVFHNCKGREEREKDKGHTKLMKSKVYLN